MTQKGRAKRLPKKHGLLVFSNLIAAARWKAFTETQKVRNGTCVSERWNASSLRLLSNSLPGLTG